METTELSTTRLSTTRLSTTRLSTKGQIILPKNIRTSRAWGPGTEFAVEETGDGILLRPAGLFPRTELDQVAGCLRSKHKSTTLAQMDAAIDREVIRRHDRGRY
jgi:AbrB family looped-hinge helix DNA binding protein